MEMSAAIAALEALAPGSTATLHSDSEYVVKGISTWITGWKARGWRIAAKKPVLNQELWERLDSLNTERQITWRWVKGHAGHEHNERVDSLANAEAEKAAQALGWTEGARYGFKPLGAS
jgi:ribonuclease HI